MKSSVPLGCTEECDCDAGFKQRQGSCGGCDENPKIRTHLSMCFFHMSITFLFMNFQACTKVEVPVLDHVFRWLITK